MNINLSANAAQMPGLLLSPKMHVTVEGRGTGKSYDIGFLIDRLVRAFPRGVIAITGQTYGQLLTRTLPSSLKVLTQMPYQKDVNFVIGKKPPTWYQDSYEQLAKFDNVISFSNGTRFVLISQSEKGSGRGANTDFEIVDEALTINKEQYDYEVVPTNRGNREFFGHIPFHHGFKYSTSMPSTKQGRWVLEYAQYYENEAGIPLFDIWNRIVKLQLELLDLECPKQFSQFWNEVQRVRKQITPFVSKDGVLFTLSNAFDNIKQLGLSYLKENRKKLPSLIFLCEMMNFLFDKVEDCFYSINESKQLYYTGFDDKKILETAVKSNYNLEILAKQSAAYDKDCNPALPLEIVFDWGSSISVMSVSQERNYDFTTGTSDKKIYQTFINEFFVKPDENKNLLIKELCNLFIEYYKTHTNKTLHFYRDRYGDNRNPNVLYSKSYNNQAIDYLKAAGWRVNEFVHKGMEPPQSQTKADALKCNEIKVVEKQSVENEMQKKQAEIELLKKQLEEQLNKIARKNEIANHREVFLEKKRAILNAEKFLKTEKGFESNSIKISFQYPGNNSSNYGGDSFSISNKSLILKFIELLIFEIEAKIKDIEYELISD